MDLNVKATPEQLAYLKTLGLDLEAEEVTAEDLAFHDAMILGDEGEQLYPNGNYIERTIIDDGTTLDREAMEKEMNDLASQ